MGRLILIRHGKSVWNIKNIFTGWTDVELAPEGIEEAKKAGTLIKGHHINVDVCYTSYLKRAIRTAWILLDHADMMHVDCLHSWKLNERHYGTWQGKNKDEVMKDVGKERFFNIRRGYDTPPPALRTNDKRHPKFDLKYKNINPNHLPVAESLKDTEKRTVGFYYESVVPKLIQDQTVLIVAHGNSLRALIEHIEKIPPKEIVDLNIPTGLPLMYEFDFEMVLLNHYNLE